MKYIISIYEKFPDALKAPYVYPLILAMLLTLIYMIDHYYRLFGGPTPIRTGIARLITVLFGSYLIIVFVDLAFKKKEERERRRIRRIALKALTTTVNSHLVLLGNWYIASVNEQPEQLPETYSEFFDEEYFEAIQELNFSKTYPTAGPGETTWSQYTQKRMSQFSEELKGIIQRYGPYLDPETIKPLEELSNSLIVKVCLSFEKIIHFDRENNIAREYNLLSSIELECFYEEHFKYLLELIKWYHQDPELDLISVQGLHAWKEDVLPHPGSARLEERT